MTEDTSAAPTVRRMSVPDAIALVNAGRAVFADTRDPRLYENLHPAGALSLPLTRIEETDGGPAVASLPRDRLLILYCA